MLGMASRISSIDVPSAPDAAIVDLASCEMAEELWSDGSTTLFKLRVSNATTKVPVNGSVPGLVSATTQDFVDEDGM